MEINNEILSPGRDVAFVVKQYHQDFFTSPRHYHREYEIAFIEESDGKLLVGNNIVDFNEGQLFMFAPRLMHCFKNHKKNVEPYKKAKAVILLFQKEFLGNDFYNLKDSIHLRKLLSNAEEGIQIVNPDPKVINMLKELPEKEGLSALINFLTILDYLSKLDDYKLLTIKWFNKHYFVLKDPRLDEILDYVEKNFHHEISYREITNLAKMSEPSFSRYFRNKTEKTFTQYVNEVRITNARKLLIETNKKILDISIECGYRNLTYFNRLFKQVNNLTPKHFRELYSSPDKVL